MQLLLERLDIFENIEIKTADGDDDDLNVYAKATKVRHAARHALLPDWDEIEAAEGITLAGRSNGVSAAETAKIIGPVEA